jgi:hypothetical protein
MPNEIVSNKDGSDNSAKSVMAQLPQLTPSRADYEALNSLKSDARTQLPSAFGADLVLTDNSKGFAPRPAQPASTRSTEAATIQPGDKINHIKDRPEMSSPMTNIDRSKIDWTPNAADKINKIPQQVEDRLNPNIRYNNIADAMQGAQQRRKPSDGTNNIKPAERPEQIKPKETPLSNHDRQQAVYEALMRSLTEPIKQGQRK